MRDAQVIIVGGGPAGSSAAFFLARAGVDVLVLDRALFPRDKVCAEYLSPECSRILHSMNALAAAEATGAAHLAGMRVRAPNGAVIHGEFASNHGFNGFRDRGLAVRRTLLDSILLDRAAGAGARIEQGMRVTDIGFKKKRATGVAVLQDGTPRSLTADLVIGADGLRSVIARRLGLQRTSRWPRRIALVSHYVAVDGVGAFGEMFVEREGYFGLADVGNGVTNVALVVPTSRAAEIAEGRTDFFEQWIAERPHLATRFSSAVRTEPVRATGPFASFSRRAWAPGAALVGDAADFFDPFTGEGIYAALHGGEILAGTMVEAIRSGSAQRVDASLASYELKRKSEFKGKWKVERLIGSVIASPRIFNRIALSLQKRRDMADLLVGVAGDFVPAREVLRPGYMMNLLYSAAFNK